MMARMTQVTDVVSTSLKSDAMSSLATTGFAKRVLVVDPDQQAWEVRTRLLIAKGYKVHRISHLADAPPRWPAHLYDLVVLATENPASPELVGFCHKLRQAHPPCVWFCCSKAQAPLRWPNRLFLADARRQRSRKRLRDGLSHQAVESPSHCVIEPLKIEFTYSSMPNDSILNDTMAQ